MWLREFTVSNFRRIENLTISFPRGLCAIVGENNTGKTAIIDSQSQTHWHIKPEERYHVENYCLLPRRCRHGER